MIFDKEDYKAYDADLWNAIAKEEERQQNNIELIASENVVSKAVMAAQGSILTNKYAEGYPAVVTMAGQMWSMWSKVSRSNGPKKSLGLNLPTFNRIQEVRQTVLPIWP